MISATIDTPYGANGWLRKYYDRFLRVSRRKTLTDSEKDRSLNLLKGFGGEVYRRYAPPEFKDAFWSIYDNIGDELKSIQI